MSEPEKIYRSRDRAVELGSHFARHMMAMTAEDLSSKAEIACELAARDAEATELRDALRGLVRHVERNRCEHDETYRAGFNWTICHQCGKKWADDEGGFRPDPEPPELRRAHDALDAVGEGRGHG